MAMVQAEAQVGLGDKLWFIPSPVASTKCLIIAHGGKLHNDGSFKVPKGLTIAFAAPAKESLSTSSRTALLAQSFKNKFAADTDCPEYSLAKFVGHPEKMDYIGLRALQHERLELKPNNCPHIVTIRSRSFITGNSKIVKLSEVVKLVKDHNAEIDTILVNACRGENDSILTLMKAALRGV